MPLQSSAMIALSLSASPTFIASVQSRSSCWSACDVLGPLAAGAPGAAAWARTIPVDAKTRSAALTSFFMLGFLSCCGFFEMGMRALTRCSTLVAEYWAVNRHIHLLLEIAIPWKH